MSVAERTQQAPPPGAPRQIPPRLPGIGRSLWSDAWRRIRRDKLAMACLILIIVYALIAVGGAAYEYAAPRLGWTPFAQSGDPEMTNVGPFRSWKYPLGTDWEGKSTLLKTLLGVKVSMTVGLMANVIAIPLGMLLGAVAGYYGGWIDDAIVWLYTTLASIPGIILLIAIKYAFQAHPFGLDLTGLQGLYIALAVLSWIGTCRIVRAEVMKIRELEYVTAARAIGTPGVVILFRHVLRNVAHLGIINFSLGFVGAITAEVTLSYLGLGVDVGTPSWGRMIDSARMDLFVGRWWELTSAVAAMFVIVLALSVIGDRLRDALDPRLRST
jgi:peptide/nickel transport system permease protein